MGSDRPSNQEGNVKVLRVCDQMYVLRTFQWVAIDPAIRKVMYMVGVSDIVLGSGESRADQWRCVLVRVVLTSGGASLM